MVISGCNNIFPTAPRSAVPADHTNNINGALHKGTNRNDMTPDECSDCHSIDLAGQVSFINGQYIWANSCYQCHGAVWERNGNGNGNGQIKNKKFNK